VPLRFVDLNPSRIQVAAFVDAAFGNNSDNSSQIGIITCLHDPETGRANIINYSSTKSRRVARSALAAELFALPDGFDVGFALKHTLSKLLRRVVSLIWYTDARSLYHLAISLAPTPAEKRLSIDIAAVRQGVELREISEIVLIQGRSNPADGCTKISANGALENLLRTNRVGIEK
jgi:hypothetical protein